MASMSKWAEFPFFKTKVDILDADRRLVQQYDAEGTINVGASVQGSLAAMAMTKPHGVHVMELDSGKILCKYILPEGEDARVALSKDATTLAVGSNTGF